MVCNIFGHLLITRIDNLISFSTITCEFTFQQVSFLFQEKNHTPVNGQNASGDLPDQTNLLAITENTQVQNPSNVASVKDLSHDQTICRYIIKGIYRKQPNDVKRFIKLI